MLRSRLQNLAKEFRVLPVKIPTDVNLLQELIHFLPLLEVMNPMTFALGGGVPLLFRPGVELGHLSPNVLQRRHNVKFGLTELDGQL